MTSYVRKAIVPLAAGAALVVGGAAPASAQVQTGLVNVVVGDVIVADLVDVTAAANVAANICGVAVGPVAVLATDVVQTNEANPVCTTGDQVAVAIAPA